MRDLQVKIRIGVMQGSLYNECDANRTRDWSPGFTLRLRLVRQNYRKRKSQQW